MNPPSVDRGGLRAGLGYLGTNRTFRHIWASQAISSLGDVLYDVAVVWFVLTTSGSALLASGIAVTTMAGRIVGSLVAGLVLDRLSSRSVMLAADLARFGLALGVAVPWALGWSPPLVLLYILGFLLAVGTGLFNPARTSAVPEVVSRDRLLGANALDAASQGMVSGSAWVVSGVAVAVLGPSVALALDAGSFLASYLVLRAVDWHSGSGSLARLERRAPLTVISWVANHGLARRVVALEGLHALAMGLFLAGLPLLILQLDGDAAVYGLQGGVFWGALLVSSSAIVARRIRRVGLLYAGGVIVNAVGNEFLGLASSTAAVLVGVLIAGLGAPAWSSGRQSLLQASVPFALRGRFFALFEMITTAAFLPMWLLGGWAADEFGPRAVMASAPLIHLGIGLLLLVSHEVRNFVLAPRAAEFQGG